jgi:hypothetical protein
LSNLFAVVFQARCSASAIGQPILGSRSGGAIGPSVTPEDALLDRCPTCANAHPGTEIYQCPRCLHYQCDLPFPALDVTVKACGNQKISCDQCDRGRTYSEVEEVARIER